MHLVGCDAHPSWPMPADTFWDAFGRNIKIGVIEDQANRDALTDLLRFNSSQAQEESISLKTYVDR